MGALLLLLGAGLQVLFYRQFNSKCEQLLFARVATKRIFIKRFFFSCKKKNHLGTISQNTLIQQSKGPK